MALRKLDKINDLFEDKINSSLKSNFNEFIVRFKSINGTSFLNTEIWNQNYCLLRHRKLVEISNKSKEIFQYQAIKSLNWSKWKGKNILLMINAAMKIEKGMKNKYDKIRQPESKFNPELPFLEIYKRLLKLDISKWFSNDYEFPTNVLADWSIVKLLRITEPPIVKDPLGHNMSMADWFKPLKKSKKKKSKENKSSIPTITFDTDVVQNNFTNPEGKQLTIVDDTVTTTKKKVGIKENDIKLTSHDLYSEDSDELREDYNRGVAIKTLAQRLLGYH